MNENQTIQSVFLDQIIVRSTKECNRVMKKGYKFVKKVFIATANRGYYSPNVIKQIHHQLLRISKRIKSIHRLYLDDKFPVNSGSTGKIIKVTKNFSSLRAIDFHDNKSERKDYQPFVNKWLRYAKNLRSVKNKRDNFFYRRVESGFKPNFKLQPNLKRLSISFNIQVRSDIPLNSFWTIKNYPHNLTSLSI